MKTLTDLISKHKAFCWYFFISVLATVADVVVSRLCESLFSVVTANTIGVVAGFVLQYFLCTAKVYAGSTKKTAAIFFVTWLGALLLADGIVYVVRSIIFDNANGILYYLIGKGCSIAIPFFITYFIRKKLIPAKET